MSETSKTPYVYASRTKHVHKKVLHKKVLLNTKVDTWPFRCKNTEPQRKVSETQPILCIYNIYRRPKSKHKLIKKKNRASFCSYSSCNMKNLNSQLVRLKQLFPSECLFDADKNGVKDLNLAC